MSERAHPSCAVLVATYNWPDALSLVLTALRAQDELPSEVLVADDGSGTATARVVAQHARTFPVPLRHIWHEDMGFRAGAIRNRAIAATRCDYIVQIDGDILLHHAAVRHHVRFARRGTFVQGSRALLPPALTGEMLTMGKARVSPLARGVRHRVNGWYVPWAAPLAARTTRDPLVRVRGCHVAYWRDDVVRVNGYNEAMIGWGLEDSELVARLQFAGVSRRALKFSAPSWHLWHDERARDAVPRNRAIYDQTLSTQATWCELGISSPTSLTSAPPTALDAHV